MLAESLAPVLSKLRCVVYPAVEDYWRAEASIASFLDAEMPAANIDGGTCGPASLAALFGRAEAEFVTATLEVPWMNRRTMEGCLKRLSVPYRKLDRQIPAQGLALIQRTRQRERKSFRGSFLTDTHWIAVVDDFVFDVNWPSWIPCSQWKGLVGDPLARQSGGIGWKVVTGYEMIVTPSCCGLQNGSDRAAVWSQTMSTE